MAYSYSPYSSYSPIFTTNSSTFIDSPVNPLSKTSILSNLSDSLTTTLVTETTHNPIISPYFGQIGSETVVKPIAANYDVISPIIPAFSPLSVYSPVIDSRSVSPIIDAYLDSPVVLSPSTSYSPYFPNTAFPTVGSISLNYTKPLVALYNDLNSDYETQETIIKYIRMKMLDKWLYSDYKDLFGYFAFDGNKVKLVGSHDKNAYKKYSEKQLEQIVDYIKKELLTTRVVSKVMHKYIKETGRQWVKVPQEEYHVKKLLGHKLKHIIREKI